MTCAYCDTPLPASSRRDRQYCTRNCSALASYYRRKAGRLPPPKWQHPAALSSDPVLRAASVRAQQLGEVHGWSLSTVRCVMDGLRLPLAERRKILDKRSSATITSGGEDTKRKFMHAKPPFCRFPKRGMLDAVDGLGRGLSSEQV